MHDAPDASVCGEEPDDRFGQVPELLRLNWAEIAGSVPELGAGKVRASLPASSRVIVLGLSELVELTGVAANAKVAAVPLTLRMRLSPVSVMYRFDCESMAMPAGALSIALVDKPESPQLPVEGEQAVVFPAIV